MEIGHTPLQIPEVINYANRILSKTTLEKLRKITNQEHDQAWRKWLTNSDHNRINGLETMKYSAFVPGTTDAFGEFISRYPTRRVRASRSDFILTKILAKNWNRTFLELENEALHENDLLIISHPFSGNGSVYPEDILDDADKLDVPVMLDAAYFGNSQGVTYDLRRKCIKDFAVSLSKCLAPDQLRLGVRFTRDEIDDGVTAGLLGSDIYDRLGCHVAIELMRQYSHNHVVDLIKPISDSICNEHNLQATNTMTLAIGPENLREKFERGDYIRVCITDEIVRNIRK